MIYILFCWSPCNFLLLCVWEPGALFNSYLYYPIEPNNLITLHYTLLPLFVYRLIDCGKVALPLGSWKLAAITAVDGRCESVGILPPAIGMLFGSAVTIRAWALHSCVFCNYVLCKRSIYSTTIYTQPHRNYVNIAGNLTLSMLKQPGAPTYPAIWHVVSTNAPISPMHDIMCSMQ